MKTQSIKAISAENNAEILASHDFNDERTVAFHSIRKKHKKDSIGWIIGGLLLFFFTLISLGRITVVGQFFDDSIFNLIFGWFKFPVYLALLTLDLCIYLGIYFKFKKRFLLMIFTSSILICWTISLILITIIYDHQTNIGGYTIPSLWPKKMFTNSFQIYWANWLEHSIYSATYAKEDKMELLISAQGYVSLYAGGGVIGTLMAACSAYLSIPGAFILLAGLLFLNSCWLFTGDAFFFFKPKDKRKGHALRILSLKGRNNPNKVVKKETEANDDYQIWKSLNVFDPNVETEIETSDLTIKLPSYSEEEKGMNLKEFDDEVLNFQPETPPVTVEAELTEPPINPVNNFTSLRPKQRPSASEIQRPAFYQSRRKQSLDQVEQNSALDNQSRAKVHFGEVESLINDLPTTGHFGDLDPNEARRLFERETNVTPFGRKQTETPPPVQDNADETSDTLFFEELYSQTLPPTDDDDF